MVHPRLVLFIFSLFQTNYFYKKSIWENVHPVYSAGIRTHNLQDVSLFPLPLDLGLLSDKPSNYLNNFKRF